jgi:hypothetical protein
MSNDLYIQWLDYSDWVTNRIIDNGVKLGGYQITQAMQEVSNYFPGKRIRAVDGNGRLVDIYN